MVIIVQVLFVDIVEINDYKYKIKQEKKFISLKLSNEFVKYIKSGSKNIFLKIAFEIEFKLLKFKLKRIIFDKVILIFSLNCDRNIEYKNLINNKIIKEINTKFYEILPKNTIDENIDRYIIDYINLFDIKIEQVKLLYFVEEFNDVVYKNIVKYINKYKFLDISYLGSTNSIKYQNMLSKINNINNEIGSTISFVKAEFNMEYNIYINFSFKNVACEYAISKKYLVINYNDIENDIYNEYNILFKNNRFSIENKLLSIDLDIKDFSINKLGQLVKNKMISL